MSLSMTMAFDDFKIQLSLSLTTAFDKISITTAFASLYPNILLWALVELKTNFIFFFSNELFKSKTLTLDLQTDKIQSETIIHIQRQAGRQQVRVPI